MSKKSQNELIWHFFGHLLEKHSSKTKSNNFGNHFLLQLTQFFCSDVRIFLTATVTTLGINLQFLIRQFKLKPQTSLSSLILRAGMPFSLTMCSIVNWWRLTGANFKPDPLGDARCSQWLLPSSVDFKKLLCAAAIFCAACKDSKFKVDPLCPVGSPQSKSKRSRIQLFLFKGLLWKTFLERHFFAAAIFL